jgi:hypothetical protein
MSNIQFVEKRAQEQQSAVSLITNSVILDTVTKQTKVYNYIARLDSQTQQRLAASRKELAQAQKEIALSSNLIA